jgi:hypothetical protein
MTDPVTPESNPYASTPQANPYTAPAANPYAAPAGSEKRPTLSLLSLALAFLSLIIGITGVGIIPAIAAVVLGHMGKAREPHARGIWLSGLILGYIAILANVVLVIVVLIVAGSLFALIPLMF